MSDDFELKIAYNNNPHYQKCSPPLGTKLVINYVVEEEGLSLQKAARQIVFSLKNKYFLEPVDEHHKDL